MKLKLCRRRFLGGVAAMGLGELATRGAVLGSGGFESFDREIEGFMKLRGVPGGSVAVVKDRRLVYARGYGWAEKEKRIPVGADSLFRIASVSKPVTAVAVMRLVEEGRLELKARAMELLDPGLLKVKGADSRLGRVTVEQLLKHTGGWDRGKSYDPMFRCRQIARSRGVESPPGPWDVIRYMAGQRLDFDPGTRYAYSNFGYCVLGRLIEKVTGKAYEAYVREALLKRIGAGRMRIGASLIGGRLAGEVRYYTSDSRVVPGVFGTEGRRGGPRVPQVYGGFYLEAMDAHGGWVASAVDLARFAAALDDPARSPLLRRKTIDLMYAAPAPPVSREKDGLLSASYYGCGWSVRPKGGGRGANYWHSGSLPGTSSLLVRRWDGLSWAVLFNLRSGNRRELPDGAIDQALHRAAAGVKGWPEGDLFGQY